MPVNLFDDMRMRELAAPYERLARKALDSYGLREAKLTALAVGNRVTFRASEADTSYALHIYPSGWDRSRIDRSLLWQTALCRAGAVCCPEPVLTFAGDLVQSLSTPGVAGFRHVLLNSWVRGEACEGAQWTREQALAAGRLIGRLHDHGTAIALPPGLAFAIPTAEVLRERFDPHQIARTLPGADETLIQGSLDRICDVLTDGVSSEGVGLIHANLTPGSILFAEDEPALIGFHQVQRGYAAYDLGTLALGFRGAEEATGLRDALLHGCAETRSVPLDADTLDAFAIWRLLDELVALLHRETAERSARRLLTTLQELA